MESSVTPVVDKNDLKSKFDEIIRALNLDAELGKDSWTTYLRIKENYVLDGDQILWLGCALYIALQKVTTPPVGNSNSYAHGNGVNLNRLLNLCNLSLDIFFNKCQLWMDMLNMPVEYRKSMEQLERNFQVSIVIFKKYQRIFGDLFVKPTTNQPNYTTSRKKKTQPCNSNQLFEFSWTLFVLLKNNAPDLVTSYHYLLACCSFIYINVVKSNRLDLLNPTFPGFPKDSSDVDDNTHSILNIIIEKYDGSSLDIKDVYEYFWKKQISSLMLNKKAVLRGDSKTLTGILDPVIFDQNFKSISDHYGEKILKNGKFDERIFLGNDYIVQIASLIRPKDNVNNTPTAPITNLAHLTIGTPLSNLSYVNNYPRCAPLSVLTTSANNVANLYTLVGGLSPEPSEVLKQFVSKSCSKSSNEKCLETVQSVYDSLAQSFFANSNSAKIKLNPAQKLFIQKLFYKFLESIVIDEPKKQSHCVLDFITREVFIKCLFGCCVIIFLHAYNFEKKIYIDVLKTLNLSYFHFYRIIELVVSIKDHLSRDIVKYLNYVEESILQEKTWESSSPLWTVLKGSNQSIPNCDDVLLKDITESNRENINSNEQAMEQILNREVLQSATTSTSAADRFQQSPNPNATLYCYSQNAGNAIVLPVANSTYTYSNNTPQRNNVVQRPRRGGSTGLFFRKFYLLISLRLTDLCNKLNIEGELRRKIWTCIESTIVQNIDIMKDRHLDQIIMCAVFLVCKLENTNMKIVNILKAYRQQPQSESHVYRSIILTSNENRVENKNHDLQLERNNDVVAPNELSVSSTTYGNGQRGDLILFYNSEYLKYGAITSFIAKTRNLTLQLSPYPKKSAIKPLQCRRVTGNITVRAMNNNFSPNAQSEGTISYQFNRSPSEDLSSINSMVKGTNTELIQGKRLLGDDDAETDAPPAKSVYRRLNSMISDREKFKE